MKKITALVLALCCVVALVGCSGGARQEERCAPQIDIVDETENVSKDAEQSNSSITPDEQYDSNWIEFLTPLFDEEELYGHVSIMGIDKSMYTVEANNIVNVKAFMDTACAAVLLGMNGSFGLPETEGISFCSEDFAVTVVETSGEYGAASMLIIMDDAENKNEIKEAYEASFASIDIMSK